MMLNKIPHPSGNIVSIMGCFIIALKKFQKTMASLIGSVNKDIMEIKLHKMQNIGQSDIAIDITDWQKS